NLKSYLRSRPRRVNPSGFFLIVVPLVLTLDISFFPFSFGFSTSSVPISFPLPSFPILLDFAVRDTGIPMPNCPIIGRQVYQNRGNFADLCPCSGIIIGSEPVPFIKPIPQVMVKQEVKINSRHKIYIPSWYGDEFRWAGKFHARRCPYPDFYASYIEV